MIRALAVDLDVRLLRQHCRTKIGTYHVKKLGNGSSQGTGYGKQRKKPSVLEGQLVNGTWKEKPIDGWSHKAVRAALGRK